MRVLITAGPTWERIDPVRYIGNRSSGRMGIALAQAAHQAGHAVTLLLGPGVDAASLPRAVTCLRFESCQDLLALLQAHWPSHDRLIMAAAVADYRPKAAAGQKLTRQDRTLTLELEPTPDLVAAMAQIRQPGQKVIAFALEHPSDLPQRAADKLQRKQVDAIVANPLATMNAHDVDAVLMWRSGRTIQPGLMSKTAFARWLIQQVTAA